MKIDPQSLSKKDVHHLLVDSVLPRPIAWVSTLDKFGRSNLAPYSTFCLMSSRPAILGFGISNTREGKKKDTLLNIEDTKEFVVNIVNEDLAEAMNLTSAYFPWGVSEFKEVKLNPEKADIVNASMVTESPIRMECRMLKILRFGKRSDVSFFVVGEILLIHIKDGLYVDGNIDPSQIKAVGRLGGGRNLYCRTGDVFELKRPENLP
jgi:flavin reductase (DIM6/NTAB) family NADH-FMN oxidoreductase RutF